MVVVGALGFFTSKSSSEPQETCCTTWATLCTRPHTLWCGFSYKAANFKHRGAAGTNGDTTVVQGEGLTGIR